MDGHLVFGHVEGNVRGMKEVVGKELLDDIAFIAAADNEIVDTVLGIDFKDVPKDRSTADLNHRLRPQTSLFTNTCAETTGKDYGFHLLSNLILGENAPNEISTDAARHTIQQGACLFQQEFLHLTSFAG